MFLGSSPSKCVIFKSQDEKEQIGQIGETDYQRMQLTQQQQQQ